MEIVSKTLFDVEVEKDVDAIGRSFDLVIREIAKRFRRPIKIADWIPLPGNLRYRRGVGLLDRLVKRVWRSAARARATGEISCRCSWPRATTTGDPCRTASCATS